MITDYDDLKAYCEANSAATSLWIDNFMMYYAAARDGLEREMETQFKKFRHVTQNFSQATVNRMKAQYIVHRVFRSGGLIRKYVNHVEVRNKGAEALKFFKHQQENPWRFSFAEVLHTPAPDFHFMVDVFTEEEYLLYSPGISKTFEEYNETVSLWFNLISFNGRCWETYGPISAYKSFDADDVFFFAGEIDDRISDESEVMKLVERNPVPFMMLISGGNLPALGYDNIPVVVQSASMEYQWTSEEVFAPEFHVEHAYGMVRLKLPPWNEPIHYSHVYIDRDAGELFCFAMTEEGFTRMVDALAKKGIRIEYPDVRVNVGATLIMEEVLGKPIRLNPYDALFDGEVISAERVQELERITTMLRHAVEDKKAGREMDYEAYAQESGLDVERVREELDPLRFELRRIMGRR